MVSGDAGGGHPHPGGLTPTLAVGRLTLAPLGRGLLALPLAADRPVHDPHDGAAVDVRADVLILLVGGTLSAPADDPAITGPERGSELRLRAVHVAALVAGARAGPADDLAFLVLEAGGAHGGRQHQSEEGEGRERLRRHGHASSVTARAWSSRSPDTYMDWSQE